MSNVYTSQTRNPMAQMLLLIMHLGIVPKNMGHSYNIKYGENIWMTISKYTDLYGGEDKDELDE